MSDVFVSYAKEDRDRAQVLAAALERCGWSVFWDRTIPPGLTWHDYIGREIEEAGCVLVAWSKSAVQSKWVLEEAGEAQRRGVLIPLFLDDVEPPLGFRSLQAADLSKWTGDVEAPALRQLIEGMERLLRPADDGGAGASESGADRTAAGPRGQAYEAFRKARSLTLTTFLRSRTGMAAIGAVLVAVVLLVLDRRPGSDESTTHELSSTFDTDDESWEGYDNGEEEGGRIKWDSDCGPGKGGCVYLVDGMHAADAANIFYFRAPTTWRDEVDWARFHGGELRYSMKRSWSKSPVNDWTPKKLPSKTTITANDPADVVIESLKNGTLVCRISERPPVNWKKYLITLKEGETGDCPSGWQWISPQGDAMPASDKHFNDVLPSVSDFRIRGEYWNGPDKVWLDDVSIRPPPRPSL